MQGYPPITGVWWTISMVFIWSMRLELGTAYKRPREGVYSHIRNSTVSEKERGNSSTVLLSNELPELDNRSFRSLNWISDSVGLAMAIIILWMIKGRLRSFSISQ
jgi:hypothetical protein